MDLASEDAYKLTRSFKHVQQPEIESGVKLIKRFPRLKRTNSADKQD